MSPTVLVILIVVVVILLSIWGIVSMIKQGMSTGHGSGFVGDAITGLYAGQDRRKAIETIRHEKEEKRYAGAIGEKYDDVLPAREGNEENRRDPDERSTH